MQYEQNDEDEIRDDDDGGDEDDGEEVDMEDVLFDMHLSSGMNDDDDDTVDANSSTNDDDLGQDEELDSIPSEVCFFCGCFRWFVVCGQRCSRLSALSWFQEPVWDFRCLVMSSIVGERSFSCCNSDHITVLKILKCYLERLGCFLVILLE